MEVIEFVVGALLVGWVLWDVFESVVVPRPTPSRVRLGENLVRWTWRFWRWVAMRTRTGLQREQFIGSYAPLAVILLLVVWLIAVVVGYGLMLFALRDQITPPPSDLLTAAYFAGASVLTIGGDLVANGPLARIVVLAAAATGFGVVALVITFLFSLFGNFQRREVLIVKLDVRAGAPPSGVALLETYGRHDLRGELPAFFSAWETWAAEVLDSHLAYPLLPYFRSSHDHESWVSALGAVLDAATLIMTTIEDGSLAQARLVHAAGRHLVEDLSHHFGFSNAPDALVERFEFEDARRRLGAAGYPLRDAEAAWLDFARVRATYASLLNAWALYWMTPPAQWIGDRSQIRHHEYPGA